MRLRHSIAVSFVAAGVLFAAACGGDEDGTGTTDAFDTSIIETGIAEPSPPPAEPPVTTAEPSEPYQIAIPKDAPIGPQSPAERIAEVQQALVLLGYKIGEADGVWGNKTRNAVVKFQKKHKLEADGLVGAQTARRMNRELRKLAASTG
jgi:peptidoglycan hydrolase-like protein with peptidoglycan-binding domain